MAMAGVVLGRVLGMVVAIAVPIIGAMGLMPAAADSDTASGHATEAAPVFDAG